MLRICIHVICKLQVHNQVSVQRKIVCIIYIYVSNYGFAFLSRCLCLILKPPYSLFIYWCFPLLLSTLKSFFNRECLPLLVLNGALCRQCPTQYGAVYRRCGYFLIFIVQLIMHSGPRNWWCGRFASRIQQCPIGGWEP